MERELGQGVQRKVCLYNTTAIYSHASYMMIWANRAYVNPEDAAKWHDMVKYRTIYSVTHIMWIRFVIYIYILVAGSCGWNLPLQADMRKYPQSVISLKSRWTTGLVCPLQVKGTCRRFAILAICPTRKGEEKGNSGWLTIKHVDLYSRSLQPSCYMEDETPEYVGFAGVLFYNLINKY